MRKVSLFMGALGGALAGYLLSNDKLRDELMKAKKPEDAAKMLGKQLAKDGKRVGMDVRKFVQSDDVQEKLRDARKFTLKKYDEAQKKMREMVKRSVKSSGKSAAGKRTTRAV